MPRSPEPAVNRPSLKLISSASACSRCAAIARPLDSTICAAWCSAVPPICIERAPPCPLPLLTALVSAWTKRNASIGSPSRSAAICGKLVSWPWPFDCVPSTRTTRSEEHTSELQSRLVISYAVFCLKKKKKKKRIQHNLSKQKKKRKK